MKFEVVLVTYRSRKLAEVFLERHDGQCPIVIVDNGRGIDRIDELASGRQSTRYLAGPGQGYAKAANLGARSSEADYLVFINPDCDAKLSQIRELIDDLETTPGLAAVAATTVSPDGKVELGVAGWEPTPLRGFVQAFGLHAIWRTAGLHARPIPGRPIEVDWLAGTCLAVPRAEFLRLGGFDESFFLFNEDVSLGRRIREMGLKMRLRTDILVPHLGGGSGDTKTRMSRMRGASMMKYVAFHNLKWRVALIRMALTIGVGLRVPYFMIKGRLDGATAQLEYLMGVWAGSALPTESSLPTGTGWSIVPAGDAGELIRNPPGRAD